MPTKAPDPPRRRAAPLSRAMCHHLPAALCTRAGPVPKVSCTWDRSCTPRSRSQRWRGAAAMLDGKLASSLFPDIHIDQLTGVNRRGSGLRDPKNDREHADVDAFEPLIGQFDLG